MAFAKTGFNMHHSICLSSRLSDALGMPALQVSSQIVYGQASVFKCPCLSFQYG